MFFVNPMSVVVPKNRLIVGMRYAAMIGILDCFDQTSPDQFCGLRDLKERMPLAFDSPFDSKVIGT